MKSAWIGLLLATNVLFGANLDLTKSKNKVEFLAVGQPSALRIRGKLNQDTSPLSGNLTINENTLTGAIKCQLDAFETGIELRDKHTKEKYLETGKFPNAELTISKTSLPASGKGKDIPFIGELTLHGVKKPVKGALETSKDGQKIENIFEFKILINDFGIEPPSYMGIKIANEVTITAEVEGTIQ